MKSIPIRVRLTLWYSVILALSLGAFGGLAYFAMNHSIRRTVDAGLRQRVEGIRAIIAEEYPEGRAALQDEFREFAEGQGTGCRVRVLTAGGDLLYASPGMANPNRDTFRQTLDRPFYESDDGEKFRTIRENLDVAGVRYDVEIAIFTGDYDRALDHFRLLLYFAAPLFLLLAAFGGYWMSRRALAPVDEITSAARNIGAKNLANRLAVPQTGDELERLGSTLNEMLARLETAFQRIAQFTADASHELRSPISVMRTSAELTLRKSRSENEYREALSQILHEAERVSQLIEQLLVLARADSGAAAMPLQRTNLTASIEKAYRQSSVFAEAKQVKSFERVPETPVWVRGDPASLERLFLILLDNAVKYTQPGGRIEVRLDTENGFAFADILDSGIGITSEDIPRVFERFYRADRARSRDTGGSGLGLAIGRWIAEAHGGEIRVQSEPGKGSSFRVKLPLSTE
ncbi:MAG: sensor histidine kinase [Candidatus Acidiferrales bacterium]